MTLNNIPNNLLKLSGRSTILTKIIFLIIISSLFFLLLKLFQIDWAATWNIIRSTSLDLYFLATFLYYLSFWFRGLRWKILSNSNEKGNSTNFVHPSTFIFSRLILEGWFVNTITWLRMGDIFRSLALAKLMNKSTFWALGTIVSERITDISMLLLLLIFSLGVYSLGNDIGTANYILISALVLSCIAVVFLMFVKFIGPAQLRKYAPNMFVGIYLRFYRGFLGIKSNLFLVSFLGLIGWILEILRLYCVVVALGLTLTPEHAILVALAGALLSVFPTPGGIGVVEPGLVGVLMLGVSRESAVAITLVDRTITYVSVVLLGGLVFIFYEMNWWKQNVQK
tara:strand:+ start:2922 stop:3938 length:1017 start_codon:yes stop_codon:yes gene_type:complete